MTESERSHGNGLAAADRNAAPEQRSRREAALGKKRERGQREGSRPRSI